MTYHVDTAPETTSLDAAAALRHRVFVGEQGVAPEIERDGLDTLAQHVVVSTADGTVVATGRLMPQGDAAKIQRVAVSPEHRGEGLGRLVMQGLEAVARDQGARTAKLASQVDAVGFYEHLGYVTYGEPFVEADILHRWMRKALEESS